MEKKIDEILKRLDKLDKLDAIEEKVNELWKYNNMDTYREYPPFVQSKSPISLTTLGENILKMYNGNAYVDKNSDILTKEIEKRGFKSPLDVQDFCEKLILSKFASDDLLSIKNHIYLNPFYENQPVTLKTMSVVMGIYLRDIFLKKHPELDIKDSIPIS